MRIKWQKNRGKKRKKKMEKKDEKGVEKMQIIWPEVYPIALDSIIHMVSSSTEAFPRNWK